MIYPILIALYVLVCVSLVVIVLLQSGKGEGLAGMLGGGGGQAIFGARAGDVLSRTTTVLAIVFMVLSLALAIFSSHRSGSLSEEIAEYAEQPPAEESSAPAQGS